MGRRQPLHPALTDPTVVYTDTLRFLCRGVLLICSILTTHPLHRSKNGANCGKLFQERMNRPDELCWSLVTVKGFYYGGGVHGIKANHRRMLYYDYTVANIAVISMKVVSVLLCVFCSSATEVTFGLGLNSTVAWDYTHPLKLPHLHL